MTSDRKLFDLMYRNYFAAFTYTAFGIVYPGAELDPNWHIDAVCMYLQDMLEGRKDRRAVVNLPPRSLKTFIVSVCFPAWLLLRNPSLEICVATYGDEFSRKVAGLFRTLVHSDFVIRLSHGQLRDSTKSTETEYVTAMGGNRFTTSVGGPLTGRGVDVLIVDDPIKADEALSESVRRKVTTWFNTAAHSRQNRPGKTLMIVTMQRVHMDDLAGHLIERGWPSLVLPATASRSERYDIGGEFYERKVGELLQPGWDSAEELERTRQLIGSYNFAAQYQQDPAPAEGNMVKREWLGTYDEPPPREKFKHIYLTCDPSGKAGSNNDYTAIVVVGVLGRDVYVLDVRRGHWGSARIKQEIEELAAFWKPTQIIIETTGQGESVRQEIDLEGRLDIRGVMQKTDKETRLSRNIGRFESGRVLLPKDAPWLAEFESELLGFPNTRNDDQLDALLMALDDLAEREEREIPSVVLDATTFWRPNPFKMPTCRY